MAEADQLNDEELVTRVRDGDQAALKALTDRYAARLEARVTRRLAPAIRRKVAASDILQEASIVAVGRVGEFEDRGAGSFGRWFGRIVELKIKEAVRRYAGTQRRDVGREISTNRLVPSIGAASPEPTPSQVLAAKQLRNAVRRALMKLPADYAHVLRLLQDDAVSIKQAAIAMGRSPEGTRKLYARALRRLKELLE